MSAPLNFSTGKEVREATYVFAPVRGRKRAKSFELVPADESCISMGMQHTAPKVVVTEINLCGWIGQAMPGDVLEYHRGFLAHDVSPQNKHRSDDERGELLRIARRAWWASEKGLVHLVQRRHRDGDYSYLVVARPKPKPASTASSSSELFMEAA